MERRAAGEHAPGRRDQDDVPHRGLARHPDPLSAILGSALTLEEGDRLGITEEERKQLIHSLAAKARRLNTIVTDLLDTERLARGVVEPKLQEIAVGRLISLLVWDSEAMAGRQVHVDTRIGERLGRSADDLPDRREPADERGTPHAVRSARCGSRCCPRATTCLIEVEDDGPGIPEEHRESIFRALRARADDLGAQPGGGHRPLARRTGSRNSTGVASWVEEREGGGASFRVLIPRGDPGGRPRGSDASRAF